MARRMAAWVAGALVAGLAIAVFWRTTGFELVDFDDTLFITHNPIIFEGLSWKSVGRAFTGLHGDKMMYVPLLWLSFLADTAAWGASPVNPWGFHLTNVLLHGANAALLYGILLFCCKGKPWRAAFLALFWALHPLRVESVAWVTERKDVLSGTFCLGCMLAYLLANGGRRKGGIPPGRERNGRWLRWMGVCFAVFAAGLLVKPMLVTVPCFFLLLDLWPLGRLDWDGKSFPRRLGPLVLEKLPFFALCGVASGVTYALQSAGAISSAYSLWKRVLWMGWNYLFYLGKTVWPSGLSPMVVRDGVPWWGYLACWAVLACLAWLAWEKRRAWPAFFTGFAGFCGMLFPVGGIVYIGLHPVADRYSYLPAVGLSLVLAGALEWGLRGGDRRRKWTVAALAVAVLAGLGWVTWRLEPTWRNTDALYARIVRVEPRHYVAIAYYGQKAFFEGRHEESDELADRMLEAQPDASPSLLTKGRALAQLVGLDEAVAFMEAHYPPQDLFGQEGMMEGWLAIGYGLLGEFGKARRCLDAKMAVAVLEPKSREQLWRLSMWIARGEGDREGVARAAEHIAGLAGRTEFEESDYLGAYAVIWNTGFFAQALPLLEGLAKKYPERVDILNNVAWMIATTEGARTDPAVAVEIAEKALAQAPGHPVVEDTLGVCLARAGRFEEAIGWAEKVLAFLETSKAMDAASLERSVRGRLESYRKGRPYLEPSAVRLLYAK